MLTILVFFLPLSILLKCFFTETGIDLKLYVLGICPLRVKIDFESKKILINKKSLIEYRKKKNKKKDKKSVRIKVSPEIVSDLDLRFFVGLQSSLDAFGRALATGIFYLLPETVKISQTNGEKPELSVSVITKITIFKLALSVLKNIKIKRK